MRSTPRFITSHAVTSVASDRRDICTVKVYSQRPWAGEILGFALIIYWLWNLILEGYFFIKGLNVNRGFERFILVSATVAALYCSWDFYHGVSFLKAWVCRNCNHWARRGFGSHSITHVRSPKLWKTNKFEKSYDWSRTNTESKNYEKMRWNK